VVFGQGMRIIMPITGDIQTFTLPAISRMIHSEKKTGILKISSGAHFTRIYFKNGAIVFIKGDLSEDLSLGALLLSERLINEEEYQKAKGIQQKSDKHLEIICLEQGFTSEENLIRTLQYQFKEAVARMLTWQEGNFEYNDGLDGFVEDIHFEMDPTRLMMEAEKWKEYRILIPNDRSVFQIKDDALRSSSFSAEGVHRVMLMIDGTRSVADIIKETGLSRVGVYKALKTLFVQGAIEREKNDIVAEAETLFGKKATMQFFLKLVGEIMADLSMELGKKKSASILDKGIRRSNHYDFLHQTIMVGESTETNIQRMNAWLIEQQKDIPSKDLYNEFKDVIAFLLIEEYNLLGFKSFKNTVQRIVEISDAMPQKEKQMAQSVITFLNNVLDDKKFRTGTEGSFNGLTTNGETKGDPNAIPFPRLGQIGGAAVIAFYSRIIQFIMDDLESAIGSKSNALIQKILESSAYHEKFLSQFNVRDDVKTNVERIRQYISEKGYRLGKISFVNGFQQVLIELLCGEKDLLGDKPTRASIMKLDAMASTFKQKEFRFLAEHLMLTIKSHGDLI
jgi:DNA-binding phage protein